MPFPAQIRPDRTGPGPRPDLAVKPLPLPVRICPGIPCRRSASASAWQAGRAVARMTAFAQPANRE